MRYFITNRKGFTLIELIIVIGILAILLSIVLVAINPAKQFSDVNDTKRRSDVKALLDAIQQYSVSNRGNISVLKITTAPQNISSTQTGFDFCNALVPAYIAALPSDPIHGTGASTGGTRIRKCDSNYDTYYVVSKEMVNQRITVSASGELAGIISVTR